MAQDAQSVIRAASQAMGVENLSSITYYGSGANFNLGQNNNANAPWPRVNANDYVRAIDFTQGVSRATWVTLAVPVTGGAAAQGAGPAEHHAGQHGMGASSSRSGSRRGDF